MNNYIDFGFGYCTNVQNNIDNEVCEKFVFHTISNNIPMNNPFHQLPNLIAPDEVFTFVSEFILPNNLNRYIISNYGRIYDLFLEKFVPDRYRKLHDGRFDHGTCHLSHLSDWNHLESVDTKPHRIELESFCHNPDFKNLTVDHVNGIFTDNRLCNLEWVSAEENIRRAAINKLNKKGGDRTLNEISFEDADKICKLYNSGYKIYDIAIELNILRSLVRDILCGFYFSEIVARNNIYNSIAIWLPDNIAHVVCDLISQGIPISNIAADTGISKYQIIDIVKRRSYLNISKFYNFENANDNYRKFLNDREVDEICRRLSLGETPAEISKEMNVAVNVIGGIKSKTVYKEFSKNFTFERINREKLDDNIVHSICMDLQNKMYNADIARKYNLAPNTISRIRNGEIYLSISSLYNIPKTEELDKNRELPDDLVHQICKLLSEGKSPQEVSEIFGIDKSKIHTIKTGSGYNDISSQYEFPRLTNVISDEQVKIVCEGLQNKTRLKDIMSSSGLCKRSVYRIRDRESHTDISKNYIW